MSIPSGNITFLFTDIEGSTKLAQDFPNTLQDALEEHNRIMMETVESNNGFVFEIIGDAFCCAFENAVDAVKSAVEAQLKLAEKKWKDAVIKIRIGIHSGKAEWNGKRYMGYITLARTARVMSAAYGEQIIISNNTYELISHQKDTKTQSQTQIYIDPSCLSDFVVKNISFRDLGERRLKDLNKPLRLFQIISDGLREDFPPLKTLDARPNNLPVQLNSFIGREGEIRYAKELLKNTRLLTLTGSGGAGKTRFSLQIGADIIDDFANGVWFAELADVSDPVFLPDTILNALGLKEEPKKTPGQTLSDHLKDKEILIILDNCEHLIDECAELTENLLHHCPKLKVIATSREALNINGEQTYRIPPLTHPDPDFKDTPEKLIKYESVRLFIERALAVNPNFRVNNENAHALAKVCLRLDGIPLAIELAASRTKIISVEKIYERIDDRFNLLSGGKRTALPRQQTLRALIDWSYDLLTEKERILWSRVSVFNGGWTLESAEDVCSDETISKNEILDLLSQLMEKSIIMYDDIKERYRILETIKHYGEEKLANKNKIFLKYLNYFSEISKKAGSELEGEKAQYWMDFIEAEHFNFQSAIEWGVIHKYTEKAAQTAADLGRFWDVRGYYSTGLKIFEIIQEQKDEFSISAEAKILKWKGIYYNNQGDYEHSEKYYKESLALYREIGDNLGIADSLTGVGNVCFFSGDYDKAQNYYEESLGICRDIRNKRGIASSLNNLGSLADARCEYEKAQKFYEESLLICREIGDKLVTAYALTGLGNLIHSRGDYETAQKHFEESLQLRRDIGDMQGISISLNNLGIAAKIRGDFKQAQRYYEEALNLRRELGDKQGIAATLNNLGNVAKFCGDNKKAREYIEESLEIYNNIGDKVGIAATLNNLGNVSFTLGEIENASKYFEKCMNLCRKLGEKRGLVYSLNSLGDISISLGDIDQAKKLLQECMILGMELGDKRLTAGILISISGLLLAIEDYYSGIKLLGAVEVGFINIKAEMEKSEREIIDRYIAILKENIDDDEFQKYREEGKNMKLDEAADFILNYKW